MLPVTRPGRDQAEAGESGHRLAAAGLADQPHNLASLDREACPLTACTVRSRPGNDLQVPIRAALPVIGVPGAAVTISMTRPLFRIEDVARRRRSIDGEYGDEDGEPGKVTVHQLSMKRVRESVAMRPHWASGAVRRCR